jgi:hypothetical protein
VVFPKAETTTAIFWFLDSLATMANTFFMFSEFATALKQNGILVTYSA